MANPYIDDQAARHEIARALAKLLADTYTLYIKTHGFHWNVVGRDFYSLHKLFEEQYGELAGAVDEIAERIRALGVKAPGSYRELGALTTIVEETGSPNASEMLGQLVADNGVVVRSAYAVATLAAAHEDIATADLATMRITAHEKSAWMLASLLSG